MSAPVTSPRGEPAAPLAAPAAAARELRIGYLVNAYPATSHSFIRREIRALEDLGARVVRYSVRPAVDLVSAEDRDEQARTRVVLGAGAAGLLLATLRAAALRPLRFARALASALRLGWASHRGVARHLAYLAEACVLAGWTRRDGVEHLHAHFGTNPATVALLCRLLGGPPYSFTVHGPEEFDKPEALGMAEKIRNAAFVIAVSSFGRSQLWRWARHDDWDKVKVVRCGLGRDLIEARATPAPAAPRLLCVARLSEQKGHLLLLEAAARLAAEGRRFDLVLAGDGPLRGAIERLIRRHGLEKHVSITGWLSGERVREELVAARALVQPSFAEGLPVVLMEALALGRPVVTTYVAGIPELVEPGVSGWLVPAGAVDELAAAMREALEAAPARLDEMGRAGRRRVAERHDAAREAAVLATLFRDAAAR